MVPANPITWESPERLESADLVGYLVVADIAVVYCIHEGLEGDARFRQTVSPTGIQFQLAQLRSMTALREVEVMADLPLTGYLYYRLLRYKQGHQYL